MRTFFSKRSIQLVMALSALGLLGANQMAQRRIAANPMPKASERAIYMVSLNIARAGDSNEVANAIGRAPRLRNADVLLLQEVRHQRGRDSVAERVARSMNYHATFAPSESALDEGLAILSRHPITESRTIPLKRIDLRFRSRNRFALAARVETPRGAVRVWNVHLDTRINSAERLAQLQPVIDDAARHHGPRLIGGDFNTNEAYWVANVVPLPGGPPHGSLIRSVMRLHGFETPLADGLHTYPQLRRHLDWMYLSGMHAVDASLEPAPFSDHHAVWIDAVL